MTLVRSTLLLTLALALMNCDREPRKTSLGPQASANEILKMQSESLAKLDPYQVQAGQRVHKVETQEVITPQGPVKSFSKEWVTEVASVKDNRGYRFLTTIKSVVDKNYDKNFIYKFKDRYTLQLVNNLSLLDQLKQKNYHTNQLITQLMDQSGLAEAEIQGVAFHNLQSREVQMTPPEQVQARPNCGGYPQCQFQADLITYDIVFLLSDGSTRTNNVEWYISSEVPFFSGILKQCATAFVPVESLRVLVKQCIDVVDFQP